MTYRRIVLQKYRRAVEHSRAPRRRRLSHSHSPNRTIMSHASCTYPRGSVYLTDHQVPKQITIIIMITIMIMIIIIIIIILLLLLLLLVIIRGNDKTGCTLVILRHNRVLLFIQLEWAQLIGRRSFSPCRDGKSPGCTLRSLLYFRTTPWFWTNTLLCRKMRLFHRPFLPQKSLCSRQRAPKYTSSRAKHTVRNRHQGPASSSSA